jgi:hypothetical protein
MREVPFSIPVSGVVRIDGDAVTITVNRADTSVSLGPEVRPGGRISLEPGKTMFDIILETAREVIRREGFNRFSAPELLAVAREKYPGLKRASFTSRVIACAPNHPSYKHYKSRRDYFSRIGTGLYWLNERYTEKRTSDEERSPSGLEKA